MAENTPADHADAMEHDLDRLGEHISDAEQQLEARRKDAQPLGDAAGDWEGEQAIGGGDDPTGAAKEERKDDDDGGDDDGDGRVDSEVANPT